LIQDGLIRPLLVIVKLTGEMDAGMAQVLGRSMAGEDIAGTQLQLSGAVGG